ncbi:MAG: nucleotidyltransferase domain-containing protein [Deltaproteobacteria bacterium]|nr:nucleotidyltransferase domain-containing protein [Deltaproteobacteria bacterium]
MDKARRGKRSVEELISDKDLLRLINKQMAGQTVLQLAVAGPHAYGYANKQSALQVTGIYVEPTEHLVGLEDAHGMANWVGEFHDQRVDYSALEVGLAFKHLLRGDGSVLERVLAPQQLILSHDLDRLQTTAKGLICTRFHGYYRSFCKGILSDIEESTHPSVQHMLSAYRTGLTGVHLLRTGKIELELTKLAEDYGVREVEQLMALNREKESLLEVRQPWTKLLVRVHALLEESYDLSELPTDPPKPAAAEEYLLDMRRRFFDAKTMRDGRLC